MNRIVQFLVKFDSRLVMGGMLLFVTLFAVEGWQLVLKKSYLDYQQTMTDKATFLKTEAQFATQISGIEESVRAVEQMYATLDAEFKQPASDDETTSVIEALDRSASQYGVALASVQPEGKKSISHFDALSFDISAVGTYLQLSTWMLSFTRTLDQHVSITEFDMKADKESEQITLSLSIVLYRPSQPNEVTQ